LRGQEKEKRKIMPPFLYRCPNTGDNVQAGLRMAPKTMT
jgi:hypothetical protein